MGGTSGWFRQATAEHWMKLKLEQQWCCVCKFWMHTIEDMGVCEGEERVYDDTCSRWTPKELPEWALPIWERIQKEV